MKNLTDAWPQIFDTTQPEAHRQEALLTAIQWPLTSDATVLLQALFNNAAESHAIRASIILALGHFSFQFPWLATPVIEWLSHYAQNSSLDRALRRCVIQALVASRNQAALPCLIRALQDSDNHIFADAAEGLSYFGPAAIDALSEVLQNPAMRDDAKCAVAWQLGEIGHMKAVPVLLATLNAQQSGQDIRALCIWALGEIGVYSLPVMDALKACRLESEPEIRLRAETALKKVVRNVN